MMVMMERGDGVVVLMEDWWRCGWWEMKEMKVEVVEEGVTSRSRCTCQHISTRYDVRIFLTSLMVGLDWFQHPKSFFNILDFLKFF